MVRVIFFWALTPVASSMFAQVPARPTPQQPEPRGIGKLMITPGPDQIFSDLKGLSAASTLIVKGTVLKSLPPRETSRGSLETDAIVSITTVLKGTATSPQVVISQRGGVTPTFNLMPMQYSLVQPGEEYLLFLTVDDRPMAPRVENLKRYLIAGLFSGLFNFRGGRVSVGAVSRDHLRSRYEGRSAQEFIDEVKAAIKQ